jgi:hypothetical protein
MKTKRWIKENKGLREEWKKEILSTKKSEWTEEVIPEKKNDELTKTLHPLINDKTENSMAKNDKEKKTGNWETQN